MRNLPHSCKRSRSPFQREVYSSGHKRHHGLRYQAVTTPDGIVVHMYGPVIGRRHDSTMLDLSGLLQHVKGTGLWFSRASARLQHLKGREESLRGVGIDFRGLFSGLRFLTYWAHAYRWCGSAACTGGGGPQYCMEGEREPTQEGAERHVVHSALAFPQRRHWSFTTSRHLEEGHTYTSS